jgi:hypothetical protein
MCIERNDIKSNGKQHDGILEIVISQNVIQEKDKGILQNDTNHTATKQSVTAK